MNIHQAERSHIEDIVDFQVVMARETEDLILNHGTVRKGVESLFDDPSKGQYYVVTENKKTIACTLTVPEWSDWRNGTVLWIHSVYVIPEHRRKGIFRLIYEYLKNKVIVNESLMGLRLYVEKSNSKAQNVYESLGMNGEHYRMYEWLKYE
ncbi:GNAT family N-acetyltransferase [Hyphobacterium sp. CCMP332]|nr:GNAT family N-acetyltransferase [Hyphobacterium sp. CCMP332]